MPPRTDSYFTARMGSLPYGPSDELYQSTFLMGNLDGAGETGEQARATNCLHCQLVHVPFFCVLLLFLEEEGWGGYFVRWRLLCLLQAIWKSLQVVESQDQRPPEQNGPWEWNRETQQTKKKTTSLRWWFAPSAPSIPVSSSEREVVGRRPDKPSWLESCQFDSQGYF